MKNIHILPTDKPSRLLINKENSLVLTSNYYSSSKPQNIYITNDEEIKEGDWITDGTKIILNRSWVDDEDYKKIILTTDIDLTKSISNPVQAIDDEFLEWFVKNPSCEQIMVIKESYGICSSKNAKCYCYSQIDEHKCPNFIREYKIIIPKEEPKQCDICRMAPRLEGTNKCESCYSVVRHFLKQDPKVKGKLLPDLRKKSETLEEAAEKWYDSTEENKGFPKIEAFKDGAKWEQERSYSEEDMKQFGLYLGDNIKSLKGKTIDELFEQFKKK